MPGPLKCVWAVPHVARSAGSGGGGGRRCTESSNGAARLVPPLPADGEDNEIASRPGFTLNLPETFLLEELGLAQPVMPRPLLRPKTGNVLDHATLGKTSPLLPE